MSSRVPVGAFEGWMKNADWCLRLGIGTKMSVRSRMRTGKFCICSNKGEVNHLSNEKKHANSRADSKLVFEAVNAHRIGEKSQNTDRPHHSRQN